MRIRNSKAGFGVVKGTLKEGVTPKRSRSWIATGLALAASLLGVQGAATYNFQQGVNGYDGTLDTQIRGASPDRNDGNLGSLSIDGSDGGGANHVLLRFEKLSGTGPGQIPPGSVVIEARLTLRFTDPGDDPGLHRMLVKWDEATTWNLFDAAAADGVTPDGVEAVVDPEVTIEAGRGTPYFETISLPLKTIQDWLDGKAPNYGWAFVPSGGGGADFDSSEATVAANRPLLTIVAGTAAEASTVIITEHPQNVTLDEGQTARFSVNHANNLGPIYTYQWLKDGAPIAGATSKEYVIDKLAQADNGAKISVRVSAAGQSATSKEATVTVTVDAAPPVLLSAKANPNQTEVVLAFSERLSQALATAASNYRITSPSGALNVTAAALSTDGTQVILTTPKQTLKTKYTVTVNNVTDTAVKPNPVAANSKAVFFAVGKIVQDANGFIVFEAENFDRNLDGLWVKDTTRGIPSGGASVVNPNGAGGSESATKLEYDVEFTKTGTHIVWYRASGDSGSDDSSWFHLDGDRPPERIDANQASMTGFQPQTDFVWRSQPQDGGGQFLIEIPAAGPHVVALARREDGSFFDKFVITTSLTYTPTGFGPSETREGAPAPPTVTITAPTEGQKLAGGASVTLTANASSASDLAIARVGFSANGNKVGEATASPFSFIWNDAKDGVYTLRATATDEVGGVTASAPVQFTVGTPPPQALLVVGTASIPNLNASDSGLKTRLESQGWQVAVVQAPASTTSDGEGKQLIITSSTVASGDVGDKFRNSAAPVLNWEQAVQDNFLMTLDSGSDRGTTDGQTQANIVKADHPLAAGLSIGPKTVTTAALPYSWGVPNANADIIATIADDPTHALVYGYDKGAKLIDDSPAPARRVMFFMGDDAFAALTPDGLKLFDAAVAWAANIVPKPAAPKLSLARTATGLTLTFNGTLQSADAVTGPWTDVANAASPFAVTTSGVQKFYRAKQ